jgi:hypothetical protein
MRACVFGQACGWSEVKGALMSHVLWSIVRTHAALRPAPPRSLSYLSRALSISIWLIG